jgi:hypothetical protein
MKVNIYWRIFVELMYQLMLQNLMSHNIMYRFYRNIEKESPFCWFHTQILLNGLIRQVWHLAEKIKR